MNKPNYYAILPAEVRYSKELAANAKLLYAEITALCNKEGFCWASNKYFADLYGIAERSIQRLIENLKETGFLKIVVDQKSNQPRKIYIIDLTTKLSPAHDKIVTSSRQNCHPSIYSINNKNNTKGKAIHFLLENLQIRFTEEFLMEYEQKFYNEKHYNAFLQDVNDEAEQDKRAFGDWLLPWMRKYARNWLKIHTKPTDVESGKSVNDIKFNV